MGSSTVGYKKADYGNFNEYITDKIRSARDAAAEERKYADDRIENLSKKEERTDEEEQLLKQLVEERSTRKKGSFFGKALAHEFGGDLLRRTKGTFSSDPSKTEDPASSKRERFSALIRGDIMRPQENVVSPEPMKQLDLPLNSTDKEAVKVEDVGLKRWLSTVFDGIIKNNNDVSKKLSSLGQQNEDQSSSEDKSSSILSKIVGSVEKLKNHFDKNNKIQQEENDINSKQLELNLDSQNQQEMSDEAAAIGKTEDTSNAVSYNKALDPENDGDKKGGGKNILGKLFDVLPIGRRFKALRRLGGMKLGRFTRGLTGGGKIPAMVPPVKPMSEGGTVVQPQQNVQPSTGIVDFPILSTNKQKQESPQTKIQPTKMSSGGRIVGSTGSTGRQKDITQNNSEVKRKLAEGGIFDNPTKLTVKEPGSFIPLYRNNPLRSAFSQTNITNRTVNKGAVDKTGQGEGYADPLAKVIQLPTMAAGGLLLSTMTSVFQNLGGIGNFLKPFLDKMMGPIAKVFGLPTSILGSIFGGAPAQAATLDAKDIADFLKGGEGKKGKKGGTGSGTPPTPPAGALSAAPTGNETDIQSIQGDAGAPIDLSSSSTVANTGLHHGNEDLRGGVRVRDYFIGGRTGPSNGSDGLGAKIYTPRYYGPLKYVKGGPYTIVFQDPSTGQQVGKYHHVNDAQHQLDGQIVQPGTFVGTQGGLPGTPSAAPNSSTVHLHVEGTDQFHNSVIKTYADGDIFKAPSSHTIANPGQTPTPPPLQRPNTPPPTPAASRGSGGSGGRRQGPGSPGYGERQDPPPRTISQRAANEARYAAVVAYRTLSSFNPLSLPFSTPW